jgi:hypothetical protein
MNVTSGEASVETRTVAAERGLGWWTDAWALFTKSALLWVALAVILIAGFVVIGMIPFLGTLATALLMPVFIGSWLVAARKVDGGAALELADLFTCFKGDRLTPLLVQGALLLVAVVVMGLVAGVLGFGAVFGMMAGGAGQHMGGTLAAMGAGMLALIAVLVLGTVISMALWFAPALVVFRNAQPVDAVRISALAVVKNWLPFLVYGLIYIVAAIVASIPFGLGWILLVPVVLLTMYVSYRDVFGA